MFEPLTMDERRHLAAKLYDAGVELAGEGDKLAFAPPSVLAAYGLPPGGCHAFYEASIEASYLSMQVWREAFVPSGTGWPVGS